MRCAHCKEAGVEVGKMPFRGPNKSSGIDYVSDCCWADLLDEKTNALLSNEEVAQALREDEVNSYVPTDE